MHEGRVFRTAGLGKFHKRFFSSSLEDMLTEGKREGGRERIADMRNINQLVTSVHRTLRSQLSHSSRATHFFFFFFFLRKTAKSR